MVVYDLDQRHQRTFQIIIVITLHLDERSLSLTHNVVNISVSAYIFTITRILQTRVEGSITVNNLWCIVSGGIIRDNDLHGASFVNWENIDFRQQSKSDARL